MDRSVRAFLFIGLLAAGIAAGDGGQGEPAPMSSIPTPAVSPAAPPPTTPQLLTTPVVDGLTAHVEVASDVRNLPSGCDQVQDPSPELRWVSPCHAGLLTGSWARQSNTATPPKWGNIKSTKAGADPLPSSGMWSDAPSTTPRPFGSPPGPHTQEIRSSGSQGDPN